MATYLVTATALRIRSGPGLSYPIIGTMPQGNLVPGDEVRGDWIHIISPENITGWSHSDYLKLVNETPPTPIQGLYQVNITSLNLRRGPGFNYTVIGSLFKGEMIEGSAISGDGQWAQVRRTTGVTGWASLKYLTKIPPPPPPGPDDIHMTVTIDSLNVRAGPSTGYTIIGKVTRGETVTYLGATPAWDWVNVRTARNITGWCLSRYLNEESDLFSSPEDYPALGLHRALTDSVFMREGPGDTYATTVALKFNRVVEVDLISPNGKWKHCTNAWGASGWYPIERLARLGDVALEKEREDFSHLHIAYLEFGTRELPGTPNNPRVQEYIMSTDLAEKYPYLPDETDWCACFVNWCIEKAGLRSANSAIVSPWRNWGVKPPTIRRGSVISFRWDDGWEHVSFYLGDIGNYVVCLGGNQSDAVWISVYHKKYVTAFRVPQT